MKIRFANARIVTMTGEPVEGDLVVDGARIAYLGGEYLGNVDRVVDCAGDILMPSLVDTHTHLGMTIMRGLADDLKLRDWLYRRIFPMEAKLDAELVRAGVRLGLAELIRGGVTGVVDMYPYPEIAFDAIEESGIEGIVCTGDNDLDGKTAERLRRQERLLARRTERVRAMPSFHAEYTCSEAYLEGVMGLCHEARVGVVAHNSETLDEVGRCCTRHDDLSPTMYLHSLGLFDYGGIVAHCVYCDKDDLSLLAQNNVAVSLNSASNCKLGSGIPPILTMKDKRNLISLGTDSAASNNRLDLWRELYLAAILPKAVLNSPEAVTARDALTFATKNGAAAMGIEGGVLAEGGVANLIRVSTDALSVTPIGDVWSALCYAGGAELVRMTMCRGRILCEDGVFANGWDASEIKREARAAAKALVSRL